MVFVRFRSFRETCIRSRCGVQVWTSGDLKLALSIDSSPHMFYLSLSTRICCLLRCFTGHGGVRRVGHSTRPSRRRVRSCRPHLEVNSFFPGYQPNNKLAFNLPVTLKGCSHLHPEAGSVRFLRTRVFNGVEFTEN